MKLTPENVWQMEETLSRPLFRGVPIGACAGQPLAHRSLHRQRGHELWPIAAESGPTLLSLLPPHQQSRNRREFLPRAGAGHLLRGRFPLP